jgi:hypothetical protein
MILRKILTGYGLSAGLFLGMSPGVKAQVFVEGLSSPRQGQDQKVREDSLEGGEFALQMIQSGIREEIQKCGLQVLNGTDERLPSSVRARNADEVFAAVLESAPEQVVVYAMADWETQGAQANDNQSTFKYMKRNGGKILNIDLNYEFNDVHVNASPGGNIAFTRTSKVNKLLRTEYRVRGASGGIKKVTKEKFEYFIQNMVVLTYSKKICQGQYK